MKNRICIICEGYEEKEYFDRLRELGVFDAGYSFVTVNAKTIGNVFPIYQDRYASDSFHLVLVFVDTDKPQHEQYEALRKKINGHHDCDIADRIIIFANPCSMQVILSHWDDVALVTQSKKQNAGIIEQLTGITDYDAHEHQRNALFQKINRGNYARMMEAKQNFSDKYTLISSSNFGILMKRLMADEYSWIEEINEKL